MIHLHFHGQWLLSEERTFVGSRVSEQQVEPGTYSPGKFATLFVLGGIVKCCEGKEHAGFEKNLQAFECDI